MALSEEEKKSLVLSQLFIKLNELSWNEFKSTLNNVTPIKIKNYIGSQLDILEDEKRNIIPTQSINTADDIKDLKIELKI